MVHYDTDDTIVAIASAPGHGARGVVRLSGPRTIDVIDACFSPLDGRPARSVTTARQIAGTIDVAGPLGAVPCTLLLWPSRRSYTRQVAAEFHLIGAPPVLSAVQRTLIAHGARLAEPGEFTLRAFLAGRIDLTQAEAVLGVVDAANDAQLNTALAQLAGGLRSPILRLRGALLDLLAELEAGLDFADQDIDFISTDELSRSLHTLEQDVVALLEQMDARAVPWDRPRVVLRGWPNTGKSSLLNALAEHAMALVADKHGTTRDYVRAEVCWQGMALELIDTAGHPAALPTTAVHDAAGGLAARMIDQAEIELLCLEATRPINAWEKEQLALPARAMRLVVLTKIDAASDIAAAWPGAVPTSSRTGQGIVQLRDRICRQLREKAECSATMAISTTLQRGRQACAAARSALQRAAHAAREQLGEELIAAELRFALDQLGQVAGVVYTDELLDQIFDRFCIGK